MGDITNPFESLNYSIVFDSRDWSQNPIDAWIYGIIVGWTSDNKAEMEGMFQEFKQKFRWERNTWDRLQLLHIEYLKYQKISEALSNNRGDTN